MSTRYDGPTVRMVCPAQGERVPCHECPKWHPHRREELVHAGDAWPKCRTHECFLEVRP